MMKPKLIVSIAGAMLLTVLLTLLCVLSFYRMRHKLADHMEAQGYYGYMTDISLGFQAIDPDQGFQPHYRILVTFYEPGLDGLDHHLLQWSITGGELQLDDPKIKELQVAEKEALTHVESAQLAVVEVENDMNAKLELTLDPEKKEALKARLQPKLTTALNARDAAADTLEHTRRILYAHVPELAE